MKYLITFADGSEIGVEGDTIVEAAQKAVKLGKAVKIEIIP